MRAFGSVPFWRPFARRPSGRLNQPWSHVAQASACPPGAAASRRKRKKGGQPDPRDFSPGKQRGHCLTGMILSGLLLPFSHLPRAWQLIQPTRKRPRHATHSSRPCTFRTNRCHRAGGAFPLPALSAAYNPTPRLAELTRFPPKQPAEPDRRNPSGIYSPGIYFPGTSAKRGILALPCTQLQN